MSSRKFATEEIKGLLKTFSIRVADAMRLWGDELGGEITPTWAEKEHAMTEYLNSRDGILTLASVIQNSVEKVPEDQPFVGLVTVNFIKATCALLVEFGNLEYPIRENKGEEELVDATPEEDK